ncbi:MAG: hypothetical protein H6837_18525 [Planctomycetes bacterium]|nr:hypothetical protein [Planctomycetota bacterium]
MNRLRIAPSFASPPPSSVVRSLLCSLALLAAAAAQGPNPVLRAGALELTQSARHPGTGYALEIPGAQPPEFSAASTSGVPAGTLTWVWIPSPLDRRLESRRVTGHMIAVRPTSSTPLVEYGRVQRGQTSPGVPVYVPKFSLHAAKARAAVPPLGPFGGGFDPDFGKPPLLRYDTVHTPLLPPHLADQTVVWTVTYNTEVRIAAAEMVMAFEWQGGEHMATSLTQSLPSGWPEQHFAPVHWGWASPPPARTMRYFDPKRILPPLSLDLYSSPFAGYFSARATVALHTDWGELRDPTLANLRAPSYTVGAGFSDLASRAGEIGWDVFAAGQDGQRALPLLDIGASPVGVGFPLLGQMLEVHPLSPVLTGLWGHPLADGRIAAGGWLPAARIRVPALGPAALGTWIGMEFAIVDPTTATARDTTQAVWFYVAR